MRSTLWTPVIANTHMSVKSYAHPHIFVVHPTRAVRSAPTRCCVVLCVYVRSRVHKSVHGFLFLFCFFAFAFTNFETKVSLQPVACTWNCTRRRLVRAGWRQVQGDPRGRRQRLHGHDLREHGRHGLSAAASGQRDQVDGGVQGPRGVGNALQPRWWIPVRSPHSSLSIHLSRSLCTVEWPFFLFILIGGSLFLLLFFFHFHFHLFFVVFLGCFSVPFLLLLLCCHQRGNTNGVRIGYHNANEHTCARPHMPLLFCLVAACLAQVPPLPCGPTSQRSVLPENTA
jgi:hypothetical protein